jgi:hypothetical protein
MVPHYSFGVLLILITRRSSLFWFLLAGDRSIHIFLRELVSNDILLSFLELRSAIVRLFGDIENRIRQFWNGFIGTYTREGMER